MADVELVIKIDAEDYRAIKNKNVVGDLTIPLVFDAIRNGTPLPKCHGRLIDGSKLENLRFSARSNVWLMDKILKSKTIVEADTEESI